MSSDPKQSIPRVQAPLPFTSQGWRPGPTNNVDYDIAMKSAFDNIFGLQATSPQTPSSLKGSQVSSGALLVTGVMNGVASGLNTLSNVVVSLDSGSSPTNMTVQATPNTITPGLFDIFVSMPTAAGDTTPIQATSPVLVRWLAWGT